MRPKRSCRLLLPLLVGVVAPLEAQAPVRVMTFNIRYGTAQDGTNAWADRRAHVIATIRDHAPHILGLQEALRFQLDELGAALAGYLEHGVGRNDGRTAGEYAAILIDTARFEVRRSGTHWLSDTPMVPGSASWGNEITRIVTWVLLSDRATGDQAWVYNVHLDHQSQPSRERSVGYVLELMRGQEHGRIARDAALAEDSGMVPVPRLILLGDFNADESNRAYRMALEGPLRSAFRAVLPDATDVDSFNGFRAGEWDSGLIDHVLVGAGWAVVDAGIDRRRFGEQWASDHFAVWAVLR
jgi:endonuclease/exonuclease/phosphatase family metal-dependent hydrolase